jgi:pimeloyl-ACP methyl ester carboxylesterase
LLWRHAVIAMLIIPTVGSALPRPRASGLAPVNGTRLYYEIYGRGTPIVLLHAGLADSRMWDQQVDYFSGRHTVLRFDARGFGRSEAPNQPYVPVDDLHDLLRFVGMNRVCVVGLSMGGTIAIDFAAAYPEAVSCLVIVAGTPAWQPYSNSLVERVTTILTAGQQKGPTAVAEGWLNDPMFAAAKSQPRLIQQMKVLLTQNAPGFLSTPYMDSPDIPVPDLDKLKIPTLVLVGDRDDKEVVDRAYTMTRSMPDAREVIIKGAGHMVNLEKPREFNRALEQFFERHPN